MSALHLHLALEPSATGVILLADSPIVLLISPLVVMSQFQILMTWVFYHFETGSFVAQAGLGLSM